jgi:hypothetical protein
MIQKDTGWTDDYILWELSWANLQLKLADAPYYKYGGKTAGKNGGVIDEEDLASFLNGIG